MSGPWAAAADAIDVLSVIGEAPPQTRTALALLELGIALNPQREARTHECSVLRASAHIRRLRKALSTSSRVDGLMDPGTPRGRLIAAAEFVLLADACLEHETNGDWYAANYLRCAEAHLRAWWLAGARGEGAARCL